MTIPVLPEEDDPACDRCGTVGLDIVWCLAFDEWLCADCRAKAAAVAHRLTLEQKRALDERAKEAS